MANTFELIASSTVGSGGAASIDFSSIPATFTDLVLKLSARCNNASVLTIVNMTYNGSTTGYSSRYLEGNGSSAASGLGSTSANSLVGAVGNNATASTFGNVEVYIPNYAGSTNKSASSDQVLETNATTTFMELYAYLWSDTAAINQITLTPASSATFLQHSTAYLYGVKNA
jgi:hypothetical protein